MEAKPVARVWLLDAPYGIDKQYDYYIPQNLRGTILPGSLVLVPFGSSNRKSAAAVVSLRDDSEYDGLKPVISTFGSGAVLTVELLGLCEFMKEHTFCTYGEAVRSMLPVSSFAKLKKTYTASDTVVPASDFSGNDKAAALYGFIKAKGKTTEAAIRQELGEAVLYFLPKLVSCGAVICDVSLEDGEKRRYEEYARLGVSIQQAKALAAKMSRSPKQSKAVELLCEQETILLSELKRELSLNSTQISSLESKGILRIEKEDKYAALPSAEKPRGFENRLSTAQTEAFDKIISLYEEKEARAALLYGITGSGKTRVMLSVIDRVIADGKSAIVLIPEISLTPQTLGLFGSYYGDSVAVWHSSLSAGEKLDAWQRMKSGRAKICVGTRSAVFAPFSDIGLIVIDEEQEHTYKSDMAPKYHARDIARYRCAKHGALMLLASATPSLESYYKASCGKYTLVELKERYGGATLPRTLIADLREDSREGRVGAVGSVLKENLENNIAAGEQSVLFINRRGYNNFLNCPVCGNVIMCPHCSVTLTYHAAKGSGGRDGMLFCHYCGYRQSVPEKCPECGNEHLRYIGFGTQKVEDEICGNISGAQVVRMDADTTTQKDSYLKITESFRRGKGNILLGTQMVTKGHDFPNVTLVGVLLADMTLYLDDYHANERSFALMTQVIGRAGRGADAGRAVIQTYNPDNPVLRYAAAQDYEGFYKNEILLRKALVFPPFCDMFLISFSSAAEAELHAAVLQFRQKMGDLLGGTFGDVKLVIFGPFEAPVYKMNEKFRMRIVAKGKSNSRTREFFKTLLTEFSDRSYKNITVNVDINPNNL